MSTVRSMLRLLIVIAVSVLVLAGGCEEEKRTPLSCVERPVLGDPSQSGYILPYPVGHSYRLMQGYCYSKGGHRNQFAYDFKALPF